MIRLKARTSMLLLEVLFTLTLLAFGITACLQAFAQGLQIARRSQEYAVSEAVMDNLMFQIISAADASLARNGGDGEIDLESSLLSGARYSVESDEIGEITVLSDEEVEALKRAGEPIPEIPHLDVEERYRTVRARLQWREGRDDVELFTVVKVPPPSSVN